MGSGLVRVGVAVTLLSLSGTGVRSARAEDGNLPGGTSISVDITAPPDGAVKVSPPGVVVLQGTASVGTGVAVPSTLIVYVLDVSFSTQSAGGTCGDQNSDGNSNTILDCEIAAIQALNNAAVTAGTVGRVGLAVFGGKNVSDPGDTGGFPADVGPAAGDQLFTGPATDANAAGGRDLNQVVMSARSEGFPGLFGGVNLFTPKDPGSNGTNFAAGLRAAVAVIANSDANPAVPAITNRMIVFLSDGLANTGGMVSGVVVPAGVTIKAFAVGGSSSCGSDPNGLGSLDDVAAKGAAGSGCTPVPTVGDLPNVVPGIVASKLSSLSLRVNAGAPVDITGSASPALPEAGPASVIFGGAGSPVLVPLAPGIHHLCVTATGSDGGGGGSVEECITVTMVTMALTPPAAVNELGTPGQTHTVTATVAAGAAGGVPALTVNFAIISGPNAGATGFGATNATGQATFTYLAKQGPAGLGTDVIRASFGPDVQGDTISDNAAKTWVDRTAPVASCVEGVNPHGNKIPPAGSTTLPGAKGGQNEDGFYRLIALDAVDPNPQIFVGTAATPLLFGPFASGTTVKITEAPGATPSIKPMAGAVTAHITLNADALITALDASGGVASVACLVPPPPK